MSTQAQKDIALRELLRGSEDPFTNLAFSYAEQNGISNEDLRNINLSSFCHTISRYPNSRYPNSRYPNASAYSRQDDFTLDRNRLAKALLLRTPDDILSDECQLIARWVVLNKRLQSDHAELLEDHLTKKQQNFSGDVRDVYQDFLASVVAAHRRIVPQSDINLAAAIQRLSRPTDMAIPGYILDGIEQNLSDKSYDPTRWNRELYRLELFRHTSCSEIPFLSLRPFCGTDLYSMPSVDANFGGVLTYADNYCCVFSGIPLDDGETFLVIQLQGSAITHCGSGRSVIEEFRLNNPHITQIPVKFNLMLAVEYAKANSFKKIALVPGKLNYSALRHEVVGDM